MSPLKLCTRTLEDEFEDPATGIYTPCRSVCHPKYADVASRVKDCRSFCPEAYQCLLGLLVTTTAKPEPPVRDRGTQDGACPQEVDHYTIHIIYLSIIIILLLIMCGATFIVLYGRQGKLRSSRGCIAQPVSEDEASAFLVSGQNLSPPSNHIPTDRSQPRQINGEVPSAPPRFPMRRQNSQDSSTQTRETTIPLGTPESVQLPESSIGLAPSRSFTVGACLTEETSPDSSSVLVVSGSGDHVRCKAYSMEHSLTDEEGAFTLPKQRPLSEDDEHSPPALTIPRSPE